jgi:hypothetical protein
LVHFNVFDYLQLISGKRSDVSDHNTVSEDTMIPEESIFQFHCETGNLNIVKEMVMSGIWKFNYNKWKYILFQCRGHEHISFSLRNRCQLER